MYREKIRALLSPAEKKIFTRLNSPQKIQDYLDTLPINFEISGETYMSPRRLIRERTAHCFEGALLAAAALAFHGQKPLLLDLQTIPADEDHVVTLFERSGLWGAISKTNHATLRYRDPVYASSRELAMSYFHEYLSWTGKKTMRAFSRPFDLSRYKPERWVTAEEDLVWLVDALDDSPHFPIASKEIFGQLRHVSATERNAANLIEWPDPRKKKQRLINN